MILLRIENKKKLNGDIPYSPVLALSDNRRRPLPICCLCEMLNRYLPTIVNTLFWIHFIFTYVTKLDFINLEIRTNQIELTVALILSNGLKENVDKIEWVTFILWCPIEYIELNTIYVTRRWIYYGIHNCIGPFPDQVIVYIRLGFNGFMDILYFFLWSGP